MDSKEQSVKIRRVEQRRTTRETMVLLLIRETMVLILVFNPVTTKNQNEMSRISRPNKRKDNNIQNMENCSTSEMQGKEEERNKMKEKDKRETQKRREL